MLSGACRWYARSGVVKATAIPEVVSSLSAAVEAVATGNVRPTFDYVRDTATGALTVTVPAEFRAAIDKVELRHASTAFSTSFLGHFPRMSQLQTAPHMPADAGLVGVAC